MINSLRKDSHITQAFRFSRMPLDSGRSVNASTGMGESERGKREYSNVPAKNSIGISVNKPAEISFSGLSSANDSVSKIYTSKWVKKFLEKAADSQAVFGAIFALGITCFLRPAAIIVTPSKKNKDDQKYAAAHSIASGIIAYFFTYIICEPISRAVKKISKEPTAFIKNRESYLVKDGKALKTAGTYLNMLPEAVIIAAPRAALTIALIPIILKYVFGMEKKKDGDVKKEQPILQNYAVMNFNNSQLSHDDVFQGLKGGAK